MAYSPIKDKDKFILNKKVGNAMAQRGGSTSSKENDRINKVVREKERAQCDERLEIPVRT